MKKIIICALATIVTILLIFKFYQFSSKKNSTSLKSKEGVTLESASAFYPLTVNLVQKIYGENSDLGRKVKMVSTSQVFNDIIAGKTDLAIVTEPSDEQKLKIESSNINLELKKIYLEPLVIFVNKNNNVENLSIEQIQKMYYSESTNWSDFGGEESTVHTYQLEKNNGSQTCFESIVKNNMLSKNHYEINTMPKIIDDVAKDKNGIGYAFYSYFEKMHKNNDVKSIKVEGKSALENEYPLLFEVYLVYRKDNTNENISKIINWLESEEGKSIVEKIK